MSDDMNIHLCILAIPTDQVAGAVAVMERYGLRADWGGPLVDSAYPEITLGDSYVDSDTYNIADDIATNLIAAAPDATFTAWTEPYDGRGAMHVPGLGRFGFNSNTAGEPVFDSREILDALANGPEAVQALTGPAWLDAIAAADRLVDDMPRARRTIKAPRCPACNHRIACAVECPDNDPTCDRRECESHDECAAAAAIEDTARAIHAARDEEAPDLRERLAAALAG